MSIAFVPCAECRRHVRHDDTNCPFCGASVAESSPVAPSDEAVARGLSRGRVALMAVVTLTASVSLAACYGGAPRGPSAYDPNVAGQVSAGSSAPDDPSTAQDASVAIAR